MNKGDKGYFKDLKRRELIKCILQWCIVIILLIVGYVIFDTKLNILTFVAVLGCLPAAKATVGVIVKWPVHSLKEDEIEKIEAISAHLTISYDVVLTSKDKIMPVQCMAISNHTVYGYTISEKINLEETASYMKNFFLQNDCGKVNVKIFNEFVPFISRVEGLNNIASVEKLDSTEKEENLKHVMKLYSM